MRLMNVVLLLPIRCILAYWKEVFHPVCLLTHFAAELNPLSDEDKTGGQYKPCAVCCCLWLHNNLEQFCTSAQTEQTLSYQ